MACPLVAQSRERELVDMLEHRQERLARFLQSLQSLCGEAGPSGGFGCEEECVAHGRRAASTAANARCRPHVSYRGRELEHVGPQAAGPGAAARPSRPHRRRCRQSAGTRWPPALDDLVVHVEFDLDDVNAIFADRAGLESNGEAFLTDNDGYRLTSTAPRERTHSTRCMMPPCRACVRRCRAGHADHRRSRRERHRRTASRRRDRRRLHRRQRQLRRCDGADPAARPPADLCVRTGRPARRRRLGADREPRHAPAQAAGGSDARAGSRPLRHARSRRGPSEVRQLGQTLSTMAASISTLVQQEQHARKEAEAANRMKDEFLATLSHELRTPLNAILGWASILTRSDYDRSRVSHAVHVIERNARIQSQMIEELLDVSRIAAGTVQLNASDVLGRGDRRRRARSRSGPPRTPRALLLVEAHRVAGPGDPGRPAASAAGHLEPAVQRGPLHARRRPRRRHARARRRRGGAARRRHRLRHRRRSSCRTSSSVSGRPTAARRARTADSASASPSCSDLVELHGGTVRAESAGEGHGRDVHRAAAGDARPAPTPRGRRRRHQAVPHG